MSFILRTKSSVDKSSVISLQPGGYLMPRGAAGMTVEPLPLRSEEHTSELQSRLQIVCRLLLEKKKNRQGTPSPPPADLLALAARLTLHGHPDDFGALVPRRPPHSPLRPRVAPPRHRHRRQYPL